ncbi:hypothetical protein BDV19DRAFT_362765 [Aspergillus venezuelensis]
MIDLRLDILIISILFSFLLRLFGGLPSSLFVYLLSHSECTARISEALGSLLNPSFTHHSRYFDLDKRQRNAILTFSALARKLSSIGLSFLHLPTTRTWVT